MFRMQYTRPLPPGSKALAGNKARLPDGREVEVNSKGRWVGHSENYYTRIRGKAVPLAPDYKTAKAMEAKLKLDAAIEARGMGALLIKPDEILLVDQVERYAADLAKRGRIPNDIETVKTRIGLLTTLGFETITDLATKTAADKIDQAIDALGKVEALKVPKGKAFTPLQVRHLLGVSPSGLSKATRTLGIAGTGQGKARTFNRAEVERLATYKSRGLSPQTLAHYRTAIGSFFRWLQRKGFLERVPYLAVQKVDRDARPRRIITWAQCQKLAAVSPPDRSALWRFAFSTMLRLRALRELVVGDLVLGARPYVKVRAGMDKKRRARTVPIEPGTAADLVKLTKGRPATAPVWELPGNLSRVLAKDLKAAGIEPRTPEGAVDVHALRHSGASHFLAKGVSVAVICHMGGWTDPKMLVQRYGHLTSENLPEVWQ